MREIVKRVKEWYDLGLWDDERVRKVVERGMLSDGEYEVVTGKAYAK